MHTSKRPIRRATVRAAGTIALGSVLALGLVAVAGAATGPSSPPGGGRFGPATFGSVAALSAATSSMEVQNQSTGQTTVDWTQSTTFSQIASVPAGSVAVGDCVTISGRQANKMLTAQTVSISQAPSGGSCSGGFQRGTGGPGGGPGQFFRNRRPGTGPPGSFRRPGNFANFGFASGQVTNVTSSTLTLSGFSSLNAAKPPAKSGSTKPTRPTPPTVGTVRVNLASSTTYSQTQSASASSLAVGDCITAAGPSASNGTVTASTIRITATGGQSCTFGGGGQFFRSGGPPPAGA